ncbi:hypothetical protein V8C42DRAFT_351331 [Trichoderma barbatum]
MPSTSLLTRIVSIELRLNNATTTDAAMSLCDDNKPPSVTTGARDDAAGPETQPPSPSLPKIHVHVQPESVAAGAPKLSESAPSVASRNPIEAAEEKLPDSHADQGSDRKSPRDNSTPTKKRPDPFARYLSDANSFPDYGDRNRRTTMGLERLKQINGLAGKPVNTLSVRRFEAHNESDAPSVKRQKKDSTRAYDSTTSPYFTTTRAKKSSEVRDVLFEPDDVFDIRSSSSAGNAGVNGISLTEYRNVLPQSRKGTRRRRSRGFSNFSSQQRDAVDPTPDVYRPPPLAPKRTLISTIPNSPDALDFEELPSGATEVVSDIPPLFSAKRERPFRLADNSGRQFKRHKPSTAREPIDISEDELQGDSAKYTGTNKKESAASRSTGISGGFKKGPMRGDLHHTNFGKLPRRRSEMIAITRAVCGKWIYKRDDHPNAVFLHCGEKEDKRLEPVSEDGQVVSSHAWLGIDLDQVRSFGCSEEPTRYGCIMRSQSGDAGPKLYLEFENDNGMRAFREALKASHAAEKFIGELEKKAERAFDEAKNWIVSNTSPKNSSRAYTRDKKENDVGPASSSLDGHPESTRAKLKDSLIQSYKDLDDSAAMQETDEVLDFDIRPSTRSSAPSTRRRMPSPVGWTLQYPDWHESWQAPLVFPPTGKNRATVDKIDIPRLDEKEFLNDNLINFYIRYLEHKLEKERPELRRKVYFFSTFFFEKLRSTKGKINYDGVKAWTAKVDLLSYDYIFVPVNEHAHWYLAIICNVPNAIQPVLEEKSSETLTNSMPNAIEVADTPSSPRLSTVERELTDISLEDGITATAARKEEADDASLRRDTASSGPPSPPKKRKFAGAAISKLNPTQPRIVTLDSLGSPHAPTCKALKEYLIEEAKTKKGVDLTTVPTGMTARGIPEQNNFCDCGVFILGYMEEFLSNPDEAARKLLMKEELGWGIRPSELRDRIRGLLFDLQSEQQKHHKQLEEEKRLRKAKKKSTAETSPRTSSPVRPVAPSSPVPKLPGAFPSDSPESKLESDAVLSSSESVQEANSLEGGGLISEAPHETQPKPKTLEEIRFISPLPGSSTSPQSTTDKALIGTSSTAPKLDGRSSRLVVELKSAKGYDKSEFEERALLDDEVQFVKELSSSPHPFAQKGGLKAAETRRRRHSSVELVEASTSRPASSSRTQNHGNKLSVNPSPQLKPRQSIEFDTDHGARGEPKYDGIDRSGKPTDETIL